MLLTNDIINHHILHHNRELFNFFLAFTYMVDSGKWWSLLMKPKLTWHLCQETNSPNWKSGCTLSNGGSVRFGGMSARQGGISMWLPKRGAGNKNSKNKQINLLKMTLLVLKQKF